MRAKNGGEKKMLDEFKRGDKMASLWHKYGAKQGTCAKWGAILLHTSIHHNTPHVSQIKHFFLDFSLLCSFRPKLSAGISCKVSYGVY